MEKEKVYRQSTKRFTITAKKGLSLENTVEIRRRLSKEEQKIQKRTCEEDAIATLEFTPIDEYKCSKMKVSGPKIEELTSDEWTEILKSVLEYNVPIWEIVFVCVDKSALPANLIPALGDFRDDPVKPGFLYYEVPVNSMVPVFWLLGMSVGMSVGISLDKMSIGLCLGLCIGMLVGYGLDSSAKKERAALKKSRGMPVSETKDHKKK